MDIEFHYYYTYLIATKAGFQPNDALIIAHSSQYVDDNDMIFKINKDTSDYYENGISQTMNILRPAKEIMYIYPLFHFIPGELEAKSALRVDGNLQVLNTTPNSKNAIEIYENALNSSNLFRIGIATHAYADTFAHQNFTGAYNHFNSTRHMKEDIAPNIGHASAGHLPDMPCAKWNDERLIEDNSLVNNKKRFLDAAEHIYSYLRKYVKPSIENTDLNSEVEILLRDLSTKVMIENDDKNDLKEDRISRCQKLAILPEYGGHALPKYDEESWINESINEDTHWFKDRNSVFGHLGFPIFAPDVYTWKNINGYRTQHWYQFQEAIKEHKIASFEILNKNIDSFSKLEAFKDWYEKIDLLKT